MKNFKILSLLLFIVFSTLIVRAQGTSPKPTIVFVHGVWADGSCWAAQITALQAKGYEVLSVQDPITSLADDVAATKRVIARAKGDVILVGHSWGGFVITQAGNDPKVVALVYVAALAPDSGETVITLSAKKPATQLHNYFQAQGEFNFLSKDGIKNAFAQDLPAKEQDLIYATQIPGAHNVDTKSGEPAWKTKPTWYIVAKSDGAINPDLERLMAKRMNAKTTEIESSHVVMMSHPKEVLAIVEEAANTPVK